MGYAKSHLRFWIYRSMVKGGESRKSKKQQSPAALAVMGAWLQFKKTGNL